LPRVPSDKTITHRIELGLPERQKLDEILEAYKQNNAIDGVTATLQAAGSALAGGGMIWAAAALAAYLAPGLIKNTVAKTKQYLDGFTQAVVDPIISDIEADIMQPVYAAGRKVTAAQERVDRFCSPGINFNEQQCTIAQNDLAAAQEEAKQAQEAAQSFPQDTKGTFEKLWDLAIPGGVFNPFDD
jgi:hypothetical protein